MHRTLTRTAALVLAGLLVLAGCGGDDGDEDTADRSTTTADEGTTASSDPDSSASTDSTEAGADEGTTAPDDDATDETPPDTADEGQGNTGAPDAEATDVDWTTNALEHRGGEGDRIAFLCPPDGQPGQVWGTETYTDDSSVCTAAVHAGIINTVEGGRVVIEIAPGEDSYEGSEANGITSQDFRSWEGSFTFPVG